MISTAALNSWISVCIKVSMYISYQEHQHMIITSVKHISIWLMYVTSKELNFALSTRNPEITYQILVLGKRVMKGFCLTLHSIHEGIKLQKNFKHLKEFKQEKPNYGYKSKRGSIMQDLHLSYMLDGQHFNLETDIKKTERNKKHQWLPGVILYQIGAWVLAFSLLRLLLYVMHLAAASWNWQYAYLCPSQLRCLWKYSIASYL